MMTERSGLLSPATSMGCLRGHVAGLRVLAKVALAEYATCREKAHCVDFHRLFVCNRYPIQCEVL